MGFWLWIFSLITFPIHWFWAYTQNLLEEKKYGSIVIAWFISLFGLGTLIFAILYVLTYLLTYHPGIIIIPCVIGWVYTYVYTKYFKATSMNDPDNFKNSEEILKNQAEKGYASMRSIIYQVARIVSNDIGAKTPRLLSEVEAIGEHYLISNGIIYYQFKLAKENYTTEYTLDELDVFKNNFQSTLRHQIESGHFNFIKTQVSRDKYNNFYDFVEIAIIEDFGNYLLLQSVYPTKEYMEYCHQQQLIKTSMNNNANITTNWNDNKL